MENTLTLKDLSNYNKGKFDNFDLTPLKIESGNYVIVTKGNYVGESEFTIIAGASSYEKLTECQKAIEDLIFVPTLEFLTYVEDFLVENYDVINKAEIIFDKDNNHFYIGRLMDTSARVELAFDMKDSFDRISKETYGKLEEAKEALTENTFTDILLVADYDLFNGVKVTPLGVHQSNAGYYIGNLRKEFEKGSMVFFEPNERISHEYYPTRGQAYVSLLTKDYSERRY